MQEEDQTTEVRKTNERVGATNVQRETVKTSAKTPGVIIAKRVIYYIGGVLISLLALRLILQLLGANPSSGFVDFIYSVSAVFVAPFFGIFGEPSFGQSQLETSALVAIVVYGLLIIGAAKLLTITRPRDE